MLTGPVLLYILKTNVHSQDSKPFSRHGREMKCLEQSEAGETDDTTRPQATSSQRIEHWKIHPPLDQSVVGAGKPTHNSYSFAPIRQADVADEVGKGKSGARSR
jgi:hypothetical protein